MIKLYYLVDQAGATDGAKQFIGIFADVAACATRAAFDGMAQYSIELETSTETTILV